MSVQDRKKYLHFQSYSKKSFCQYINFVHEDQIALEAVKTPKISREINLTMSH